MKIIDALKALMVRVVLAAGVAAVPAMFHPAASAAADLKEVNFSEAVHNLGYINLYVGMHAGIFEKNGQADGRLAREHPVSRPDLRDRRQLGSGDDSCGSY
ncbi:hypothetical protein [Aurantimonas sp. VKM B-3413]|uniref:hypothetical protein n=1 Tax=Aurantimonas sp. VKM B-3413 TaxID=2779401 RepID=UPI001E49296F|nr:hypothetical protein [Aurantimonas sp. VKM B-3413]MCB8839784.1 hypothetical protein [Aurantimonas sp. VKM B-3413]